MLSLGIGLDAIADRRRPQMLVERFDHFRRSIGVRLRAADYSSALIEFA